MLTSLTKENFWDSISKIAPDQVKHFRDWIDEYKKRVNWNSVFNGEDAFDWNGDRVFAPKYDDLPVAMQIGIFIQYCMEMQVRYPLIEGMPLDFEQWATLIRFWFHDKRDSEVRLDYFETFIRNPDNLAFN